MIYNVQVLGSFVTIVGSVLLVGVDEDGKSMGVYLCYP
jgi:hypothetical protein